MKKYNGSTQNIEQKIIVCGHTHIPRVVYLANGKIIINPGSVGLQHTKMSYLLCIKWNQELRMQNM